MFGCLTNYFSLEQNLKLSEYSLNFIRNSKNYLKLYDQTPPIIRYNPTGSLLLASPNEAHILTQLFKSQGDHGSNAKILTKRKLAELFPWMNISNIELGLYGFRNSGWYDVPAYREALRIKSLALGTTIIQAEPIYFEFNNRQDFIMEHEKPGDYQGTNKIIIKTSDGQIRPINFGFLINTETGGANPVDWLNKISKMLHIGDKTRSSTYLKKELPIVTKKRKLFSIYNENGPGMNCPILLDDSGLFLRREGLAGEYICSLYDNENNDDTIREKTLETLINRIPSFKNAKIINEFKTEYSYNSFDGSGFIGPHPHFTNVYFACCFNTLEAQIAPALSNSISDMIIEGQLFDNDVGDFSFDRLFTNEPIHELIAL